MQNEGIFIRQSYYKGTMLSRKQYEDLSVKELKSGYKNLIKKNYRFRSKEEELKHLFEDFSCDNNYATRDYSKKTIESVLKEKTGEEYKVETKTYDISLDDVINYTVQDPYFVKSISEFLNKLDDVNEDDKMFFIISLYHVKDSFNEFTREVSGFQDAKELFNKYKDVGIDYEMKHRIDAYLYPRGSKYCKY